MSADAQTIGAQRSRAAALVVGTLFGLVALHLLFAGSKTNFEQAAFAEGSRAVFDVVDGVPNHCQDKRDIDRCLAATVGRGPRTTLLWLGNSQLQGVNQWKAGETNAPAMLFRLLGPRALYPLTLSQPNANLQEHQVLFEYVRTRLALRALILPLVFDDLRESGLRTDVAALSPEAPKAAVTDDYAGLANTVQDRSERALNEWLDENSSLWKLRPEVRGRIFTSLYQLRNTVFGIKPTTKRKMLPARYRANLQALEQMLIAARKAEIPVILYIVPLRNDVEPPYDATEYTEFKRTAEVLAARESAHFFNIEALVPGEYWGTKASTNLGEEEELDFMHFTSAGHELMATRMREMIIESLGIK